VIVAAQGPAGPDETQWSVPPARPPSAVCTTAPAGMATSQPSTVAAAEKVLVTAQPLVLVAVRVTRSFPGVA